MRPNPPGPRALRGLLAIGLLLAPACERPASDAPRPPGLTVVASGTEHFPHYHDFGKVRHGARVERTFVILNGDAQDVTIESIQTACQCTQVKRIAALDPGGRESLGDPTREGELVVVPAGGELHLTLGVDTGMIIKPNADKLSVVRLRSDSTTPFLTFELHVIPQKLFELSPPEVRLDEVPIDHGETIALRILRGDPTFVADVVGVASTGKGLEATIEKDFHFDDPVWTVLLTVPPGETLGPFRDQLILTTTDDEGRSDDGSLRELPVPVHGHYVENIRLHPQVFTFGSLERGSEGLIDAYLRTLVPGARVKVVRTEVLGEAAEHLRVECKPRAEDSQGRSPVWEVYVSTDGQLPPGPFEGRVRFELDDSQTPRIERRFRGEVLAGD